MTDAGRERLAGLGVDADPAAVVPHCVDWTEQRHHLAGSVAAALTARLFDRAR